MRKWYEYKQSAVKICRSLNKLDLRVWNRLDIMTDLIHHSPTCRIKVYKKKCGLPEYIHRDGENGVAVCSTSSRFYDVLWLNVENVAATKRH